MFDLQQFFCQRLENVGFLQRNDKYKIGPKYVPLVAKELIEYIKTEGFAFTPEAHIALQNNKEAKISLDEKEMLIRFNSVGVYITIFGPDYCKDFSIYYSPFLAEGDRMNDVLLAIITYTDSDFCARGQFDFLTGDNQFTAYNTESVNYARSLIQSRNADEPSNPYEDINNNYFKDLLFELLDSRNVILPDYTVQEHMDLTKESVVNNFNNHFLNALEQNNTR